MNQSIRKLAVILHADVIGSTDLVQRNETLAHERIRDAFRDFSKIIQSYDGTPQELRGDALLATFNRASSTADRAAKPLECNEDGLPTISERYCCVNFHTRGSTGIAEA